MPESRIVSFEEIGEEREGFACFYCLKNGDIRPADVFLLISSPSEKMHVGLCANHAECLDPQTIKSWDDLNFGELIEKLQDGEWIEKLRGKQQ